MTTLLAAGRVEVGLRKSEPPNVRYDALPFFALLLRRYHSSVSLQIELSITASLDPGNFFLTLSRYQARNR